MKKLVSVVAPLYNEESLVVAYCDEVFRVFKNIEDDYSLELILVDDGSSDSTYQKMADMKSRFPNIITTVRLSRNFGLEAAVQAGLNVAEGDAVVVMDADLQDPPDVIIEMINNWKAGADVVVARRKSRPNDSLFKTLTARIYYKVLDMLSGRIKLEKDAANYRLLDREAVNKLNALPEVNRVFRVLVPFLGMKTAVVEYERDKRYAGETKYNFRSMVRYALDGITGISIEPLRKVPLIMNFTVLLSLGMLTGALLFSGLYQAVFVSLFILSILFALLFLALSVIAEYIGQIFVEVKRRPDSISYTISSRSNDNF
ncbi:glycosyltransferase family 2 protein [Vibrio cholerae]|uniref:glycosyltransferase family 2 protein n=1 Tax=Vibrio cholerae TaxID=666 RepID=UPI000C7F1AEA|nr:glycosyltransferase family 2 protein [Vibrio cholerae]PKQ51803.1 glycosyltransferase [Vibrio cholerae]TXY76820.1 glycosyltransferase family 2 protein [Vibrio cholerae]BCN16761.1 putative glycosyltransferase [Vibrio cholerae]GHX13719.1 glycosyltransferase [Vibrio cholerae]